MIHYLLLNKDAYDAAMGEITSIFQLKKQQRSSEGLPSEFDGIITDTELNSMIVSVCIHDTTLDGVHALCMYIFDAYEFSIERIYQKL